MADYDFEDDDPDWEWDHLDWEEDEDYWEDDLDWDKVEEEDYDEERWKED